MTAPKPKSAVEELTNTIVEILNGRKTTEFEIASLKRKSKTLLDSNKGDKAACWMCLGLIEFHQKDISLAIKYLENASRLDPSNSGIFENLIMAYSEIGNFNEMISCCDLTLSKFKSIKSTLIAAMVHSLSTFQLSKACAYFEQYNKIDLDAVNTIPQHLVANFELTQNFFKTCNLSEEQIFQFITTASDTLKKNNILIFSNDKVFVGDGTVLFYFNIDADSDACADASFLIAEALAEQFEETGMDYISIACRPLAHLDYRRFEVIK